MDIITKKIRCILLPVLLMITPSLMATTLLEELKEKAKPLSKKEADAIIKKLMANPHPVRNRPVSLPGSRLVPSHEEFFKEKNKGPKSKEEIALRKRVAERWKAIISYQYDKVYEEFTSPAYRKIYGKTHFHNQYGGQITRTKIKTHYVEFKNNEKTQAIVHIDIFYILIPDYGKALETSSYNKEAWVKVEGQWWHVERR